MSQTKYIRLCLQGAFHCTMRQAFPDAETGEIFTFRYFTYGAGGGDCGLSLK